MTPIRILVATASRHGATAEIGEWIAATLRNDLAAAGYSADVDAVAIDDDLSIADADAVIVGSALYFGRWLPAARRLVRRQQDSLIDRPVWLFSSGPVDQGGDRNGKRPGSTWDDVYWATEHRTFGGKLDASLLGPMERVVVRSIGAPDSDDRRRDEVEQHGV